MTQAGDVSELFAAMRILGLVLYHEVSNRFLLVRRLARFLGSRGSRSYLREVGKDRMIFSNFANIRHGGEK